LRWRPASQLSLPVNSSTCVSVSTFQLRLCIALRLSPPTDPPAMPSDQPPACAFNQSSGSTFQLTLRLASLNQPSGSALEPNFQLVTVAVSSDLAFVLAFGLRLVSTLRLCFPPGFQLAPSANLPASPSNSTSDLRRLLRSPVLPSDRSPACAFDRSSGSAFQPAFDLRLRPVFQPCP